MNKKYFEIKLKVNKTSSPLTLLTEDKYLGMKSH